MLETIYRKEHFYVFHVDYRSDHVRKELNKRIEQRFLYKNIKILPKDRSFIASWGSWGIVRAQLEIFEELCRMGIWDFMINMSGADLAMRSIEDISMALAPYRGHSFFAFHIDKPRNYNLTIDQGLCKEAWASCDAFTYNITRGYGMPKMSELTIRTASQWATLSREFVEDLLDQENHPLPFKKYNYHMQTSIIPDESYIPTFAFNHPNHKNKINKVGLYFLKKFEGNDAYNLCRHTDDCDFCGQGPSDINVNDMHELLENSHRYFFARKFETSNVRDSVRQEIINLNTGDYYNVINHYVPEIVFNQLMVNAAKALTPDLLIKNVVKLNLRVIPKLNPAQPCCSLPFDKHYKSVQEYYYIIDFDAIDNNDKKNISSCKILIYTADNLLSTWRFKSHSSNIVDSRRIERKKTIKY